MRESVGVCLFVYEGGGDVCSHSDEGSRHLVALVNAFSEAVDTRERDRHYCIVDDIVILFPIAP